jgi:hypothetical protein
LYATAGNDRHDDSGDDQGVPNPVSYKEVGKEKSA